MFDLEKAILLWRRHMTTAGIKSPVPLEELESHLREEIERQIKSGLSEAEAFDLAVELMGMAGALHVEFDKGESNVLRESNIARFCLVVAALTYIICGTFGLLHADLTLRSRLLGFAAIAVSIPSLFRGRYVLQLFPILLQWRPRLAVQVGLAFAPAVWMMIYAYLILPHFDFTIGEIVVATLWALIPWIFLGGVMNAVEEARHGKTIQADA